MICSSDRERSSFPSSIRIPPAAAKWLIAVGLTIMLGCGQAGSDKYNVRGTITYRGQALQRGTVNFFPQEGKPLGGPLQKDGTYEFELPAGEYRVAIRANTEIADDWKEGGGLPADFKSLLPSHYARPDTSRLTAKIVAQDEPNICDFHLE